MPWRLKSILVAFFTATAVALSVRLFLFENYRVFSASMTPGLGDGDLVLVSKLSFNIHVPFSSYELLRIRTPRPGEVVMFTVPDHGLDSFVKRVVAVEGDRVSIQDGVLSVNGKPAEYVARDEANHVFEEVLPDGTRFGVVWEKAKIENYGPVDVPKGYFFALADNRGDSTDSRTWGPIPLACLKGKAAKVL